MRGAGKKKAESAPMVRGWLPPWAEIVAGALGVFYLVVLVSGQTKKDPLGPRLPALVQHFVEAPGLFPHAALNIIDYRLEAWSCREQTFREIDPIPYFPMRPDDKENRFRRLAQFYHSNAPILDAFDAWLAAAHDGPHAPDGIDGPVGGIRLYSLRMAIPPHGEGERWNPRPLAELPASVKKLWYQTTLPMRNQRCAGRT